MSRLHWFSEQPPQGSCSEIPLWWLLGDTLVVVARRYPCGGCSEKLRCGCLENVSVGVARVDSVVVARRSGIKLFSFTNTVETIVLHHTRPQAKRKVYGTRYSQAVTHPSTNRAGRCLTSVIGREPVLST